MVKNMSQKRGRGRPEKDQRRFGKYILNKRACARSLQEVEALKKSYKEQGKKVRVVEGPKGNPECNFKIYTD